MLQTKMEPFLGTKLPQENLLLGIIKNIEYRQEAKKTRAIIVQMEKNPELRIGIRDLEKVVKMLPEYFSQPLTDSSELRPIRHFLENINNDNLEITDESQITVMKNINEIIQKIRHQENIIRAIKNNIEIG